MMTIRLSDEGEAMDSRDTLDAALAYVFALWMETDEAQTFFIEDEDGNTVAAIVREHFDEDELHLATVYLGEDEPYVENVYAVID